MKKIILLITSFILSLSLVSTPTFATSGANTFAVETSILKSCGEEAEGTDGGGIICILKLVVDIMTIGIGILATIGITISGIQYLTAGGNEEQTKKAKRRIYEIVIGLAAYVLIYALLSWLLPNFSI